MNWHDVLPANIARNQTIWERRQAVLRMREAGLTFGQIGKRLDLNQERARQIYQRAIQRKERPPVQTYLESAIDFLLLEKLMSPGHKLNQRLRKNRTPWPAD